MPERIQRKRVKGWRLPAGAVCVTRPGRFGNPFKSAAAFREWLVNRIVDVPSLLPGYGSNYFDIVALSQRRLEILRRLPELRQFLSGCWRRHLMKPEIRIEVLAKQYAENAQAAYLAGYCPLDWAWLSADYWRSRLLKCPNSGVVLL